MAKSIKLEDLVGVIDGGQQTPTQTQVNDANEAAQAGATAGSGITGANIGGFQTQEQALGERLQETVDDAIERTTGGSSLLDPETNYLQEIEENFPSFVETEKQTLEVDALAVGRTLRIVPQNVYGSVEQYVSDSDPTKNFVFLAGNGDPLRGRTALYWSAKPSKDGIQYSADLAQFKRSFGIDIRATGLGLGGLDPTDYKIKTQSTFRLTPFRNKFENGEGQYTSDLWKAYTLGGSYTGTTSRGNINQEFSPTMVAGQDFTDHVHQMPLPFSRKQLEKMNSPINALSAQVRPEYNFYIKSYETKIMEDPEVLENTLPNMYVFLSELNQENPNPEFNNFISLDESFETPVDSFINSTREFDIKTHPFGQYYDIYARQYNKGKTNGAVTRLNQKFSNLVVSADEVSILKEFNEKREMFPMYVDIEFSTDKSTTFAQILKDSNLSEAFMTAVVNRITSNTADLISCQEVIEDVAQGINSNPVRVSDLSERQKRYWLVDDVIESIAQDEEELNDSSVYLGEYANTKKTLARPEYRLFKNIMYQIFRGKLAKLSRDKTRSFKEILEGKPAYSETVFYRVAKYERDVDGQLLQNYYFPNSNEIDVLRFIDTQVKYNKQYTYVVFAYQLVFGNKYSYRAPRLLSDDKVSNTVDNETNLALFEHEFYRFTGKVLDDSPVSPDIDIVPYKGVDDRVLVLMRSNVGNFVQDPVIIKPEDQERIESFRQERELEPGSPIRFKADDYVDRFEVYRLEEHPKSYSDFEKSLRNVVDVGGGEQLATAGSFIDKIQPNKKYYYTFRGIDVHDNFSNPTPVIRIEMINENGTVFLLKDVVGFAEEPKESVKTARRFIQLVPTTIQTLINEEKSGYEQATSATQVARQIHLGEANEGLWGKNFKIRLTSKSSGKKIDFFVKFEHEHKEKA